MPKEKTDKKSSLRNNGSCLADAGEVKEAMLLNALEDEIDERGKEDKIKKVENREK